MGWGCLIIILISIISPAADPSLSYAEYEKLISEYQNRNKVLREQIAQEQAAVLDLKNRIEATKKNIAEIRIKKFKALGISEEDVAAILEDIENLRKDVSSLQGVSDELFIGDSVRIYSFRHRLQSLRSMPASKLSKVSQRIDTTATLIERCEQRLEKLSESIRTASASDTSVNAEQKREVESYTVMKVDEKEESLFNIAAKVYGDPLQWPKIYQANKEIIDRKFRQYRKGSKTCPYTQPEDLIFPGQVLIIPK